MFKFSFVIVVLAALAVLACDVRTFSRNNEASTESSPTGTPAPSPKLDGKGAEAGKTYFYRGLELESRGEYLNAIEQFKLSIESGNDEPELYRRIANLYRSLGIYQEEVVFLRKLLSKKPNDSMAQSALANVLVWNLQDYENGLNEAVLAKRLDRSKTAYVYERTIGKAYDGLKDYKSALVHYKIFLKKSAFIPDSANYKEVKKRVQELEKER